jgi:hypothetical protein
MRKRSYALERGQPEALTLGWDPATRDVEVALGDATWRLELPAAKAKGASLFLPDGSKLTVSRTDWRWYTLEPWHDLDVDRDGVPVPGSPGDPRMVGRRAGGLILFFAAARILILAGGLLGAWGSGERPGLLVVETAIEGALLLLLGILAMMGKRLPVALATAMLAAGVAVVLVAGGRPHPVGLVIHLVLIASMVHAWKRMAPREKQPSLAQVFE